MTIHKKELRTMLDMLKKAGENEIDKISVRTVLDTLISLTKRIEELEKEEPDEEVGILERLKMARVSALANKLVDVLRTEQQSIGQCTLTMLLVDSSIRNDISKAEFLDAMNSFWDGRVKELEEDNQDGDEDE
jgi:hypothetical protein